jgi:hypothetical protein
MEALLETTVWPGSESPNHTYLLDGTNLVAYIKKGESTPFYFKNPIKNFDKRGRKFTTVKPNPFTKVKEKSTIIKVTGSKGSVYSLDTEDKTCTCPGFTYRGSCKHIAELIK